MDIKIIKLFTTHNHITDLNFMSPVVEEKIIGVVNVHEDITELVDLYNKKYTVTIEDYTSVNEQRIETQVISLSTIQELVDQLIFSDNGNGQNGQLKSGSQALEELKIKMNT